MKTFLIAAGLMAAMLGTAPASAAPIAGNAPALAAPAPQRDMRDHRRDDRRWDRRDDRRWHNRRRSAAITAGCASAAAARAGMTNGRGGPRAAPFLLAQAAPAMRCSAAMIILPLAREDHDGAGPLPSGKAGNHHRRYQRFFPSITATGQSAASKSSSNRALIAIRRVLPSQLPSRWKSGLSA